MEWLGVFALIFAVARFLDDHYIDEPARAKIREALRRAGNEVAPEEPAAHTVAAILLMLVAIGIVLATNAFMDWFAADFKGLDTLRDWVAVAVLLGGYGMAAFIGLNAILAVGQVGMAHFFKMSADPRRSPFTYGAALISLLIAMSKYVGD